MTSALVFAASNGIAVAIAHDADTARTLPNARKIAATERITGCIPDPPLHKQQTDDAPECGAAGAK